MDSAKDLAHKTFGLLWPPRDPSKNQAGSGPATATPTLSKLTQPTIDRQFRVVKIRKEPKPAKAKSNYAYCHQTAVDEQVRKRQAKDEAASRAAQDEVKYVYKPLPPTSQAHFLDLSSELREKIYTHLFEHRYVEIDCDYPVVPTACPEILLVSRQVNHEASKICDDMTELRITKNRLDHYRQIEGALDYLGATRLHRLRRFVFAWSRKPFLVVVQLMHNPQQDLATFKHMGIREDPPPKLLRSGYILHDFLPSHYAKIAGHRHFVAVIRLATAARDEWQEIQTFCDEMALVTSSKLDSLLSAQTGDLGLTKGSVLALSKLVDATALKALPQRILSRWQRKKDLKDFEPYPVAQGNPQKEDGDEECPIRRVTQ